MGEVYRARDTKLNRDVAIKVLPDSFASDADRLARFTREAQTLASLNHPNIAQIHGLEESNGVRALVMELVEGEDLSQRIARGAIPIDEALPIAKQIAEALEAAHEHGIVHRDLKPANIKLRDDGTVKVLDFGLAKAMEPAVSSPAVSQSPTITSPAMTQLGVIVGTAAYMAPEQARGKTVDKRADIWAFGCVLYQMLTGRRAFAGDDVSDVLASVLAREPDWTLLPAGLSPVLVTFLRRCLLKDRKHRVGDAQSLRLALEGAFETAASQVTQGGLVAPPRWRRVLPVAAALMVGGVLVGLAAWGLWPSLRPQTVTRFNYRLPSDQFFRSVGWPVLAMSPDGRQFVYNATGGLYRRAMDALEARLIPGLELATISPFFSPDGQSVGYFDSGQLKRISISGGAAVDICAATIGFGASWGTDNTILFGQPKGIMRVSANGGTPELVIPAKEGEQVYGPQLLPDGDSVLFSVTTASGATRWDAAQIVVQSLSTGARTVVLRGGSDARYVPTGHLVYALSDTLFAIAFDASRQAVSGGPVPVVKGVARAGNPAANTAAANYGVSNEGTLLYLEAGKGGFFPAGPQPTSTLVWVDRQGQEEPLTTPPGRYNYARLSPDGTRVALDVRDQGNISIWDVRRQRMAQLTFDPALDSLPVWSPDGQRLVWASQRAGPLNLYWQAADGTGAAERLGESRNAQRPSSFTPDGQLLLLSDGPPGTAAQDLGVLTLKGDRRVTWLVKTPSSELNGEISPNGRWLAYESNHESGRFQIYVRPFSAVDQGLWRVSVDGGRQPLWARNGRELFFLAPDGTIMGVSVDVPRDTASFPPVTPAAIVAGEGYLASIGNSLGRTYDVSPDGARFLRIKIKEGADDSSGPRNLVFVQNWFEELKRLVPTK